MSIEITQEQIAILIANKIIPASATKAQVAYFFEVCKRKRLDPFLKQVHMIERRSKNSREEWETSYTIQASLDGMRAIAQRNCKIKSYRRWTERDSEQRIYGCCEIDTEDRGLYSDKVPFSEYVQKTNAGTVTKFWAQFPETMIKKVAEESVLRMLAPEDLSGVYGDEEMEQSDKGELIEAKIKGEIQPSPVAVPLIAAVPKDETQAVIASMSPDDDPVAVKAIADRELGKRELPYENEIMPIGAKSNGKKFKDCTAFQIAQALKATDRPDIAAAYPDLKKKLTAYQNDLGMPF